MTKYYSGWSLLCIVFLLLGLIFYLMNSSFTYLDKRFSYNANIISFDNFYDVKNKRYTGEVLSNTRFSYQVDSSYSHTLIIKNVFDVRKPSGEHIFAVTRHYGVDQNTGMHLKHHGDRERRGYLFGPKQADKSSFTYWHINYNTSIEMEFSEEEYVDGVKIYKYTSEFTADQTKELSFLPGVTDSLGIELDVKLTLWIEPVTGYMIKYKDHATAYYYFLANKKRLYPWNQFRNAFEQISVDEQIQRVKLYIEEYYWKTYYIPTGFVFALFLILLLSYKGEKTSGWRTYISVSVVGFLGLAISSLLYYSYETQSKIKQKQSFDTHCNRIRLLLQKEMFKNFDVLYTFKAHFESLKVISNDEINTFSSKITPRARSIQSIDWYPKVPRNQYKVFENVHQLTIKSSFDRPYLYPLAHRTHQASKDQLGEDLFMDYRLSETVLTVAETNQFAVSPPYQIDHVSYVKVFTPIFKKSELKGFFAIEMNVSKLVEEAYSLSYQPIDISFFIHISGELVYTSSQKDKGTELTKNSSLQVGNRLWSLIFLSHTSMNQERVNALFLLFGGISVTLLLCTFLFKLLTDNRKELLALNAQLNAHTMELERKNKELEQFTYIASHDLQEPLRTVINYIKLFQTRYGDAFDENAKLFYTYISDASIHMQELVKTLLDYSRLGKKAEYEQVDSLAVIHEIKNHLSQLISEANAVIIANHLPEVYVMKVEFTQLLQNLIHNAIKFRKKDVAPIISITATEEDDFWTFAVKDNGIGIPEKYFEKIFVIFRKLHSRKEYEGTGIGLANCKKIVEIHGGNLWLESKEGEGTTFYFTLKDTRGKNNKLDTFN